jgi:hypothetical protein
MVGDGTTPDVDQRGVGFRRIREDRLDIGAIEYSPSLPAQGLIVSTNSDVVDSDFSPGELSLREAIMLANDVVGPDTITFDPAVSTINLTSQLPTIVEGVSIDGPGADLLTIDAGLGGDGLRNGNGFRILDIDDGVDGSLIPVEISGLTLTGGDVTGSGGAIENREDLTLRDAIIESNYASSRGGGVISIDSGGQAQLSIQNSIIHDNSSGGDGGGVANFGNMSIAESTLSGNVSGDDGAAVFTYFYDSATIVDSLLSGNTAYGFGGGIYSVQSNVTVSNSTLSGNDAVRGGGIWQRGYLDLSNSTLTGNSAVNGGGIYGYRFRSATINNTIIANSTGTDIFTSIGFTKSGSNNLIENSSTVGLTNSLTGDPQLGPLADNGGATLTHAPLPGSQVIDAGDPLAVAGVGSTPEFDQRGVGFDRVAAGRIDIGAFEMAAIIDPDFNNDGNIDGVDIDMLQGNIVAGPADPALFDLTGDGLVTIADRDEWLVQAGAANLSSGNAYLIGDANLDGSVSGQDFVAWNSNKFTSNSAWTAGDFNADGNVSGQDFVLWNSNKFQSADHVSQPVVGKRVSTHHRDRWFASHEDDDSDHLASDTLFKHLTAFVR